MQLGYRNLFPKVCSAVRLSAVGASKPRADEDKEKSLKADDSKRSYWTGSSLRASIFLR